MPTMPTMSPVLGTRPDARAGVAPNSRRGILWRSLQRPLMVTARL